MKNVNAENLNSVMDFDHVIHVNAAGTVTSDPNESAYFDLSMYKGDDGEWHDDFQLPDGWTLMRGYTGQYGYNGPVMHQSEYIGGGMADDILSTPGYYVALDVGSDCGYTEDFCTAESGCNLCGQCFCVRLKPKFCDSPGRAGNRILKSPSSSGL